MEQRADPTANTFDYGLAPGETYEPDTIDEIDRTQPHIMTVLGPVEPGALGVTNMASSFATLREDPAAVLTEIEEAGFVGLNALVDLNPLSTRTEAETAHWLAGRCDLHLIVTTGPHRGSGLEDMLKTAQNGFGATGVLPGAIVSALDQQALEAAEQARISTSLPLVVQAGSLTTHAALLDPLRQAGVNPAGLIVAGTIHDPEPLLDAGITLLLQINHREGAPAAAAMIARLVKQQLTERIVVGFDPQTGTGPVSTPDASRWSWLIEQFPLMLLDAGLDAVTVRTLMIDNPNRVLTIDSPAPAG